MGERISDVRFPPKNRHSALTLKNFDRRGLPHTVTSVGIALQLATPGPVTDSRLIVIIDE
jgi:hypothetical protein